MSSPLADLTSCRFQSHSSSSLCVCWAAFPFHFHPQQLVLHGFPPILCSAPRPYTFFEYSHYRVTGLSALSELLADTEIVHHRDSACRRNCFGNVRILVMNCRNTNTAKNTATGTFTADFNTWPSPASSKSTLRTSFNSDRCFVSSSALDGEASMCACIASCANP